MNKAAIKKALNAILETLRVVNNLYETIYIAHNVLDLLKEFKEFRAKNENFKVKLKGFKPQYHLKNSAEVENKVALEY